MSFVFLHNRYPMAPPTRTKNSQNFSHHAINPQEVNLPPPKKFHQIFPQITLISPTKPPQTFTNTDNRIGMG